MPAHFAAEFVAGGVGVFDADAGSGVGVVCMERGRVRVDGRRIAALDFGVGLDDAGACDFRVFDALVRGVVGARGEAGVRDEWGNFGWSWVGRDISGMVSLAQEE
jgi:hypothetical protein